VDDGGLSQILTPVSDKLVFIADLDSSRQALQIILRKNAKFFNIY
jgi:hypothetical protein